MGTNLDGGVIGYSQLYETQSFVTGMLTFGITAEHHFPISPCRVPLLFRPNPESRIVPHRHSKLSIVIF